MEASTLLGVKSTENLWVYPLVGFETYLIYERDKNKVSACDRNSGRVFSEKELSWVYRNMSFEDFVRYSKNCFLFNLNFN
jgi:hypothetical protein